MTTDRIHSHWPAPNKAPDPDAFKPSRVPEPNGFFQDIERANDGSIISWGNWVQTENGREVIYVKPPLSGNYELIIGFGKICSHPPDLSNCVAIW